MTLVGKATAPFAKQGHEVTYSKKCSLPRRPLESGPLRAMCGRLRVGKENPHVADWSEQPCVRPVCAVHMTAGHNALRGSGPDQKHAFEDAVARMGCPDRRIDRRCITCCSPSQPLRHAGDVGAISFRPLARPAPGSVRSSPSSPRPSWRACWQARWPRPWWAGGPTIA